MQSKLPDINAGIVTYRNVMLMSYSKHDYKKVVSALRAIIAFMPEEFQLEINTEKYYEQKNAKKFIICKTCKPENNQNEIPFNSIHLFDKLLDPIEQIIVGQKYTKYWICPNCKQDQSLSLSQNTIEKMHDPSYFKIIPSPPVMHDTFDRIDFETKFANWFEIVGPELEHQIGLFRSTYVAEGDEDSIDDADQQSIDDYDDI